MLHTSISMTLVEIGARLRSCLTTAFGAFSSQFQQGTDASVWHGKVAIDMARFAKRHNIF